MPSCDRAISRSFRCGAKSASRIRSRTGWSLRSCAGTPMPNEIRRVISLMTNAIPPSASRSERVSSVRTALLPHADVVADAGRRDETLVRDAAADRLAVARVVVGAEDAEVRVTGIHAALELREATCVHVPECLDRAHRLTPFHCWRSRDTGRSRTAVARFAGASLTARPRCLEPPRGFEPLRPGSKPGALIPLSYGGKVRAEGVEPPLSGF